MSNRYDRYLLVWLARRPWTLLVALGVLALGIVTYQAVVIQRLTDERAHAVRLLLEGVPGCDCGEALRLGCSISASCMRDEMVCCEILDPSGPPIDADTP